MLHALLSLLYACTVLLESDSTNDFIAPTTKQLVGYVNLLNIKGSEIKLSECGYRKFNKNDYELLVDVGNIAPVLA